MVFGLDVHHSFSFRYWKSHLDLTVFHSFVEEKDYIHGREMYLMSEWKNFDLIIGRKKYLWSRGDQLWNQGLWQPQFGWNALRKEEQGLFSFFIDNFFLNDTFHFVTFYSPFFIPDTDPSFKLKNGKFISKNPWFISYQEEVHVEGLYDRKLSLDIHYALLEFEKKDILWNHGAGFNTGFSFNQGQFVSLSYAYKPMNRFTEAIARPRLDLESEEVKVIVEVAPRLSYHHLLTFDFGKEVVQDYRGWNYWVSLNYERPINQSILGHENKLADGQFKQIKESLFTTLYLGYDWNKGLRNFTQFYLSYGKLVRGGIESEGDFFLPEVERNFLNPYIYNDVFKIGFKRSSLRVFNHLLSSAFQVIYDRMYKGIMFETNFDLSLRKNWLLNFSSNIVGFFGDIDELPFFYRYQFSDYIQMGLKYIF